MAAASKSKSKRGGGTSASTGADEEEATTKAARYGCYCQTFNCFENLDGIGCPRYVKKAAKDILTITTEAGHCH